jgi:uroporphyrinogen-III synthase
MRVVVTREKGFNDELRAWLPEGAVIDEVPLTATRYFDVADVEKTLKADPHYGTFSVLAVTSARSAPYVPAAHAALREGGRILAVGDATAASLEAKGVSVDGVGETGALGLAHAITEGPVLQLGAASSRDELRAALEAKGIHLTSLACYETWPAILNASEEQALRQGDVIFIGAPSAWSVAQGLVRPDALVVVPGATTAEVVRRTHEGVLEGWGLDLRARLTAL